MVISLLFAVVNGLKIDLYAFDITEMRHIHWMVYVTTQTILKILKNYCGETRRVP